MYLALDITSLAQWLSWLERRPVTAEVTGSSPVWVGKGVQRIRSGEAPYNMGS